MLHAAFFSIFLNITPKSLRTRILLLIFFCSIFFPAIKAYGQTVAQRDSVKLQILVSNVEKNLNTKDFNHHYERARLASEEIIKKGHAYSGKAGKIFLSLKLHKIEDLIAKAENEKATALIRESVTQSRESKDWKSLAYLYAQYAGICINERKIDIGMQYYNKSAALCKKINNNDLLADCYESIGLAYGEMDNSEKQMEYYFKSLDIREKNNDKDIHNSYLNIGYQFQQSKNYDKAQFYYNKALTTLKKEKNNAVLVYVYIYISDLYRRMKDFPKVKDYGEKALALAITLGDASAKADAKNMLGIACRVGGDYRGALKNHIQSLDLYESINNNIGALQAANQLGEDYYAMDSIIKIQPSKQSTLLPKFIQNAHANNLPLDLALQSLEYAKGIAAVYGIADDKRYNARLFKKTYIAKGDYKNAFYMQAIEQKLKDSISAERSKAKGLENELQYQYNKKTALDSINMVLLKKTAEARVEKEKTARRVSYFGLALITMVLLLLYVRFKYIKKQKEVIIESQKALVERKHKEIIQTELDYLKAQINPHFLFNALNTIYFKINKTNTNAREALLGFSEILRYQLYECNFDKVLIDKEIKYLQDYIHLQLLRRSENCRHNITISETVVNFEIAPLILVNFVENAFKHLRTNKELINEITVVMDKIGDTFIFEVTNDKNPDETINKEANGIGLQNVKRRLDLIYGDNYKMEIENTPDKYKVSLHIRIVQS